MRQYIPIDLWFYNQCKHLESSANHLTPKGGVFCHTLSHHVMFDVFGSPYLTVPADFTRFTAAPDILALRKPFPLSGFEQESTPACCHDRPIAELLAARVN
jgi:hypothetical protein